MEPGTRQALFQRSAEAKPSAWYSGLSGLVILIETISNSRHRMGALLEGNAPLKDNMTLLKTAIADNWVPQLKNIICL